ncbi:MAG: AAA family ATPase, partial [Thermosphaera sp.]
AELINARFFKYLLTRFTEPDELFGPLDINELRNGRYVRITKGKLPEAEIAFIDEVFNANSAILNMLLSIMNERIVYDGYSEIKVPLWTMISATNRVPDEVELQALYDRFLLRHFVKPVEENKWGALLDAVWTIESGLYAHGEPVLTIEDLVKINGLVYQVDISSVKEKLIKLYGIFEDQGIHVTDRRKGKALKIIAANALLRQSMKATQDDLFALRYVVPRDVEEVEKTYVILLDEIEAREKHLKELSEIEANVREAKIYISNTPELDPRLLDYLRSFETVKEKVRRMAAESSDDEVKRRAIDVLSEVSEVIDLIKKKLVM